MLNRYEEANDAYQAALELAEDSPGFTHDPRVAQARSEALSLTSLGLARLGWPVKGLEQGNRALQLALHRPQLRPQAHACEALAWNSYATGDIDQADRYILKGFDLAEAMAPSPGPPPGNNANLPPSVLPHVDALHVIAAHCRLANGELDRVWTHLAPPSDGSPLDSGPPESGTPTSSLELSSQAYSLRGETYRLLESFPQAIASFQKGITGSPDSFETLENLFRLGLALGQSGNLDQGMRCIEQAGQHAHRTGLGTIELSGLLGRAFLLHLAGEAENACQIAEQVQARAEERGLVFVSAAACLLKAETLLARNQPEAAVPLIYSPIEMARSRNHLWLEIDGLDLACRAAHLTGGDEPAARLRLEELLDRLAGCTTHPELRPLVVAYRQKRLSRAIMGVQ